MSRASAPRSAPTIYDVARECGVAPSTVSRALSRPGRVSAKTSERVRAVAAQLGYQPNPLARYLPTGRTGTIAMAVADITNPVYFPMIRGAERAASAAGYTSVLVDVEESAEREREALSRLVRGVDGFAIAAPRLSDAAIRAIARQRPLVTLNRVTAQVPSVVIDNERGMERAVKHLVALGHRGLTYVAGPDDSWANSVRWLALRRASAELGIRVRRVGPHSPTVEGGRSAATELACRSATAVVAYNDLLAIGVMQALPGRVPNDLSVVGFDNIVGADWCSPALTTVEAPMYDLGATAMRNLLALIGGADGRSIRPLVLPTRLVVRGSTGPKTPSA